MGLSSKLALFLYLWNAVPAFAFVVVRAVSARNEAMILVSSDAANPVTEGDSVCLFERSKPFACGTVIKKAKTGDAVKLKWSTRHLALGARYEIARQNRVPASAPGVIAFGGSSTAEASTGKKSGLSVFLAAGASGNTTQIAPDAHLQFRVSERFRMGLLFSYSKSTDPGGAASLLGGFLTFQFVPFSNVPSLSLLAMGGIYNLSSTVGASTESAILISQAFALEWRQFIVGGLFLSVAGGLQYTTNPLLLLADVNVAGTKPLALVQLGLGF